MKRIRIVPKVCPLITIALILLANFLVPFEVNAQRQMEKLGRGVIAIKSSSTQVYVGWRLLGNDPDDIAFNLYRSANGATAVKVNASPITATTDYLDTPGNLSTTAYTYSVKPVLNGAEVADTWANPLSGPATLPANAPTRQYIPIPMQPTPDDASAGVSYSVKFCWVGDLDGDGEYDFIVDRTNPNVDARQWLQAYKRDGTLLWQMNMGPNSVNHYNITPGSSSIGIGHGDNVTVYDLDGDGKSEVIGRTANGVIFADGTTLTTTGSDNEIQFLSILDGMTGVEKARATIPNPWLHASSIPAGTSQMNGHMGIVYADGMKPSVFWQSSNRNTDQSFNDIATTWDYRSGTLTQRWSWPFTGHSPTAHQVRLADVNNDGKDEYLDIGLVLKADGSAQINPDVLNEVIHGDRFHTTDIDPDRPGLETFLIQQNNGTGLATVYQSADKSAVIKKWYAGAVVDVGRGTVGAFDPSQKGLQFFSTQPGTFDCKGNQIYSAQPFPPETIWWDSDLGREFVSTIGSTATSPGIDKFNTANPGSTSRLFSIYSDPQAPNSPYNNYIAYGGRPQFWGDILGDWREELLCVASDNSELRIYTTKISDVAKTSGTTGFRIYTLMHNPQYRIQATTKGYVQSSYVDYYLGYGMTPPQPPPMVDAKLVWRGGAGASTWDVGVTPSWLQSGTNSVFTNGDGVRFDISGNNTTPVTLTGTLQPGAITVYSPKDYSFTGTGILSGTTKLTKAGSGALTISGTHSYTGKTTVWDGALIVNGDLQQSPVTVWGGTWGGWLANGLTGGRISGTGRISQPVAVKYRGAIVPGAGMNSAGTLTMGAGLTAEDGSAMVFDLSDDPTGLVKVNDKIAVTANLSLSGTVHLVIKPLNGQLGSGTYTLMTYTGSLIGTTSNFAVTVPPGTPYTLAAGGGAVTLTIPSTRPAASVVWAGGISGNKWDVAASQNWKRSGALDVFVAGDSVSFDDTGTANPTVTLADAMPVASVIVNSSTNYTITGAGSISGSGGLTKSGSGTLTIASTNDYTGPTTINGGVLAVDNLNDGGAASSLGAASTSGSNLVINSGTLRLTASQTNTNRNLTLGPLGGTFDVASASSSLQISGTIAGGALTKVGPGTLILASANTYAGGTVINAGTVYLAGSVPNNSGLGIGSVTLNNATLTMSDVQNNDTPSWNIIVPTGMTGRLNADGRCSINGSLTGGGDFTFWTGYVRTDLSGNWSNFTGRIFAVSDSGGGDFRVNNTNNYANCEINLGDHVYAYSLKGGTCIVGALSGSSLAVIDTNTGSSGKQTTWQVGALNRSTTFAGSILETAALTKTGTATLTLSGSNNYSGATTVSAGTLLVSGSITSAANATVQNTATLNLSAGTLTIPTTTINSGGTFTGCGTVNGSIVNNGTFISACGGALNVSGNVTNNATMRVTNGTTLQSTGAFTNNGTLDIITGGALPANFVNHGTVLDSSSVRVRQITNTGTGVQISIQSAVGHNYQLQRKTALVSGSWQSINAAQAGSGNMLILSDTAGTVGSQGFYRIFVSP